MILLAILPCFFITSQIAHHHDIDEQHIGWAEEKSMDTRHLGVPHITLTFITAVLARNTRDCKST